MNSPEVSCLKNSRYSDSQILSILKQAENECKVPDLCREYGMSSAAFCKWRGKPAAIRCDNGHEYISHKIQIWAEKQNIQINYIQPGNPQQNAYIELSVMSG